VTARLPVAPRALLVAAAIPILFLHVSFQPGFSVTLGGTSVSAYLSDFAVLAVVLAALVALPRERARLRAAWWLWLIAGAFFVWIAVELAWGRHVTPGYPLAAHATTAAKFFEYALLAPAVALLLRTRSDVLTVLWSLALWSAVATVVGVAQFFGSHIAGGKGVAGHRQASFLSDADFAALSAAVLLLGLLAFAAPRARVPRSLAVLACAAGALGTILAAAVASVLGIATALVVAAVALLRSRRPSVARVAALVGVAAVTAAGVVAIRAGDLTRFARFVGASSHTEGRQANVQTYSQHTLLAWIGYRIWRAHPVLGAGWQGSADPGAFVPVLPAAHHRFPDEAAQAFPSAAPNRRYGVQNAWVEALADLGVIGFLLWLGTFAAAAWAAWRPPRRPAGSVVGHAADTRPANRAASGGLGLLALAWTALLAWLWAAQGFVAGIPLDALTWLAFGLAATRVQLA
jgi:O-antigen ligase